jgi:hypothetical protein
LSSSSVSAIAVAVAVAHRLFEFAARLYIYGAQRRHEVAQQRVVVVVCVLGGGGVLVEDGAGRGRAPRVVHLLGDGVVCVEPKAHGVVHRGGARPRAGDTGEAFEVVAAVGAGVQRAHAREEASVEGGAGHRHGQAVQQPPRRRAQDFFGLLFFSFVGVKHLGRVKLTAI